MASKAQLIRSRDAGILLGLLALCLAVGSVWDLPLSQALYNPENLVCQALAAYGQAPGAFVVAATGTLLVRALGPHPQASSTVLAGIGVIANLGALAYLVHDPANYITLALPFRVTIALALVGAVDIVIWRLSRGVSPHELRCYAGFLISVFAVEHLLVTVLKDVWGRPRMRMLATTPEATFQPWWVIGSGQREALGVLGVAAEEFRSFPSGHTASAACAMLVATLPVLQPNLASRRTVLFWAGAACTAIVGWSRIVMGAHFLSDVTAGFLITFAVVLAGSWLFYRNRLPSEGAGDSAKA